jgi:hypothetical protein
VDTKERMVQLTVDQASLLMGAARAYVKLAEAKRPPCRLPGVEKAIAEVRQQMAEMTKERLADGGGR